VCTARVGPQGIGSDRGSCTPFFHSDPIVRETPSCQPPRQAKRDPLRRIPERPSLSLRLFARRRRGKVARGPSTTKAPKQHKPLKSSRSHRVARTVLDVKDGRAGHPRRPWAQRGQEHLLAKMLVMKWSTASGLTPQQSGIGPGDDCTTAGWQGPATRHADACTPSRRTTQLRTPGPPFAGWGEDGGTSSSAGSISRWVVREGQYATPASKGQHHSHHAPLDDLRGRAQRHRRRPRLDCCTQYGHHLYHKGFGPKVSGASRKEGLGGCSPRRRRAPGTNCDTAAAGWATCSRRLNRLCLPSPVARIPVSFLLNILGPEPSRC